MRKLFPIITILIFALSLSAQMTGTNSREELPPLPSGYELNETRNVYTGDLLQIMLLDAATLTFRGRNALDTRFLTIAYRPTTKDQSLIFVYTENKKTSKPNSFAASSLIVDGESTETSPCNIIDRKKIGKLYFVTAFTNIDDETRNRILTAKSLKASCGEETIETDSDNLKALSYFALKLKLIKNEEIKPPNEITEEQVRRVTDDAGKSFKQGLYYLQDNRRDKAREDFNRSIEFFLLSGIDVQRSEDLSDCYNQLIETIYRIEFPSERQPPNIRNLSTACRWEIKNELADDIAKTVLASPNETTAGNNPTGQLQAGFSDQTFKVSPLDELAKLELTATEDDKGKPQPKQPGKTKVSVKANNGQPVKNTNLNQNNNAKPSQAKDGKVSAVMEWFNENLHDPYSMRFVRWSKVEKELRRSVEYWAVCVKYRAKNSMGAYILASKKFFIRDGKLAFYIEAECEKQEIESPAQNNPKPARTRPSEIRIVRAMSGDTVATLARRYGADPVKVAKFNGLLVNSRVGAGREIRIPNQ